MIFLLLIYYFQVFFSKFKNKKAKNKINGLAALAATTTAQTVLWNELFVKKNNSQIIKNVAWLNWSRVPFL